MLEFLSLGANTLLTSDVSVPRASPRTPKSNFILDYVQR